MAQSLVYDFVRNMWVDGRVDAAFVEFQVEMGRLTRAEADEILALPQKPKA